MSNRKLSRADIEQHDEHGPFGPLGALTGDIYKLVEEARAAKDDRLLAFARWAHERVCLTRFQLRGEPWPTDRVMPDRPIAGDR